MNFFHFVDNALHGDKKPGGGAFGFLDKQVERAGHDLGIGTGKLRTKKNIQQTVQKGTQDTFTRPAAEALGSLRTNQFTYHPNSRVEKAVFGDKPIQNIQKKTKNSYDTHANLPTWERLALAGGEAGASIAQDAPFFGAYARGSKLAVKEGLKQADLAAKPFRILDHEMTDIRKLFHEGHIPGRVSDAEANSAHRALKRAKVDPNDRHAVGEVILKMNAYNVKKAKVKDINSKFGVDKLGLSTKDVSGDLAKATEPGQVKKSLEGIEHPTIIDKVANPISLTRDQHIIGNVIDRAKMPPPIPKPPVEAPAIEAPKDAATQVIEALNGKSGFQPGGETARGAKSIRAEQEALYSVARGEKFTKSAAEGEKLPGSQGYFAEKSQLKGPLPKIAYEGLAQKQGDEAAEKIFTAGRQQIQQTDNNVFTRLGLEPRSAKFNTQTALRKVTHGEEGVPTASDIKLLENVFGKAMADEVKSSLPIAQRASELAAQLANVPRTLLTSLLDLSYGLRQGLVLGSRHPAEWTRANVESVKYLKDEAYFNKDMVRMARDKEFDKISKEMRVALPGITKEGEEAFAAIDLAKHIPGVKRTARAYDGAATRNRFDVAKKLLRQYREKGKDLTKQDLLDLGEYINNSSGRGGKAGGLLDKHSGLLSTTLFSPRLWASRLNTLNPYYYYRLSGPAQAQALQSAASFATVAGTALTALAAMGAEIETDPRSSDFLKAKFGDTRYDILGGFQQNLVFAWRELSNETKSSTTGHVAKLSGEDKPYGGRNRFDVGTDLISNKLNPTIAAPVAFLKGEDRGGQPLDPKEELARLFAPLNFQSAYDAYKETGSVGKGVAESIPGFFGTGVQSYGIKDLGLSKNQNKYIKQLQSNGADPNQIAASKLFFQYQKTGPDRDEFSKKIKDALNGRDVSKAERLAQDYNKQYTATFKPWLDKYPRYSNDKELLKSYNSKKITSASFNRWIAEIEKGVSL